jgi:hypothetical protein
MIITNKFTQEDIGKHFYTYHLRLTNRGNRFYRCYKVFEIKLVSIENSHGLYSPKFEIIKVPDDREETLPVISSLKNFVNHYYYYTPFFTTKESAIKSFDEQIMNASKSVKSSEDRIKMLKLCHNKKSDIDMAYEWYDHLSTEQKKYILLIKDQIQTV